MYSTAARGIRFVAIVVLASTANGLLNLLIRVNDLPLFFDSVFTAVSTALYGLPAGVAVGVLSNVVMELLAGGTEGFVYLVFAPVNALTAVVVWAFVRARRFSTPYDALLCTLAVTLVNSAAGAATVVLVFGGASDGSVDFVVTAVLLTGIPVWLSAFLARIPLNLIDKSFTVAAAYAATIIFRRRGTGRSSQEVIPPTG